MKISKLPPEAIDRHHVVVNEHAPACVRALAQRTGRVAELRRIAGGDFPKAGIMRDALATQKRAESELPEALKLEAEAGKIAADAQRAASSVKAFVDTDVEVELAEVSAPNGHDLAGVRTEEAALYSERARILALPAGADPAGVEAWLAPGFRAAEAELDALISRYPHVLNDPVTRDTMIALGTVLVSRDAARDCICSRINARADAVIPPGDRPGAIAKIDARLAQLLPLDVHFVFAAIANGRTDVSFGPLVPAPVILGITVVERRANLAS